MGPDGFIYVDANTNGGACSGLKRSRAKPSWLLCWTPRAASSITHGRTCCQRKGVLFTALSNRRNGVQRRTSYSIAVADVPSGKHRVIVHDRCTRANASSGHLLYVTTNKTLMVVPFDQNSMKVVGERPRSPKVCGWDSGFSGPRGFSDRDAGIRDWARDRVSRSSCG